VNGIAGYREFDGFWRAPEWIFAVKSQTHEFLPWALAGGIIGFLLAREEKAGHDAAWWASVVGLNIVLVITVAMSMHRTQSRFSMRMLVLCQVVIALEATAVHWWGAMGIAIAYLAMTPLWVRVVLKSNCND
jgi:hypothetical protein